MAPLPDGTIPLSIYEIELESLALDLAEKIAKFGEENVTLYQSDLTPEQMAEELEQVKGQRYDLDAEIEVAKRSVDPKELVGGSTGDAVLDQELLDLQRAEQAAADPQVGEDVSPDDALAALAAEMDSLGL